jgi:hypothetical protein
MATWDEFAAQAPDLAAAVKQRFDAHRHKTMATVRTDGGPRISGTEVEVRDGQVWLGGMPGNRRFADLRREPRVAIHSGSDEPDSWSGDAKIGGVAVEVTDPAVRSWFLGQLEQAPPGEFELMRVDLTDATHVGLDDAHEALVVRTWRPGRPVTEVRR